MAKTNKINAPISMLAVIQRINRKLAAKGQILKRARRPWVKPRRYYIVDLSGNVMDADINPEALARKLGMLKEGEDVKREKIQGRKARPETITGRLEPEHTE
jgi:hypothetical protein